MDYANNKVDREMGILDDHYSKKGHLFLASRAKGQKTSIRVIGEQACHEGRGKLASQHLSSTEGKKSIPNRKEIGKGKKRGGAGQAT